ncbi:MAG TPA: hypothetical protein VGR56_05865 [Nitrososphaerales archaeon]|nr:hypothetical protein [Nitrososphaerales archaeon]
MGQNFLKAVILAWISSTAIDFFLNGGVFTSYFRSGDSFIVSPSDAFVRIPLGYISLLLLVLVLAYFIDKGSVSTINGGMKMSLIYALVVASSSVLGLWSITVVPAAFLLIWFVDQVLELTVAGTVLSMVKVSPSKHIARYVAIVAMALFTGGVALQNLLA